MAPLRNMITKHKKHIEHWYLYTCLTIITLGTLLVGYWLIFPLRVMEFTKQTLVDKTTYNAGDRIEYTITYFKYGDWVGTIYRSIVDGTIVAFSPVTNNLPKGCRSTVKGDMVIPDYLSTGVYHLEATASYKVNPIRTVNISWKSQEFSVYNNKI